MGILFKVKYNFLFFKYGKKKERKKERKKKRKKEIKTKINSSDSILFQERKKKKHLTGREYKEETTTAKR